MKNKVFVETPFEKARTPGAKDIKPRKRRKGMRTGDVVEHPRWGSGEIMESTPEKVKVVYRRRSGSPKDWIQLEHDPKEFHEHKQMIRGKKYFTMFMEKAEPLEKAKRIYVPSSPKRKAYYRMDPRTKELEQKRQERETRVAKVRETIDRGEVYLDTAFGFYKVTAYRDDTGWVATYPVGVIPNERNRRSFMVSLYELEESHQAKVREKMSEQKVEIERPFEDVGAPPIPDQRDWQAKREWKQAKPERLEKIDQEISETVKQLEDLETIRQDPQKRELYTEADKYFKLYLSAESKFLKQHYRKLWNKATEKIANKEMFLNNKIKRLKNKKTEEMLNKKLLTAILTGAVGMESKWITSSRVKGWGHSTAGWEANTDGDANTISLRYQSSEFTKEEQQLKNWENFKTKLIPQLLKNGFAYTINENEHRVVVTGYSPKPIEIERPFESVHKQARYIEIGEPTKVDKYVEELKTSSPDYLKPEVRQKVNKGIHNVTKNIYYEEIPLKDVFDVLNRNGLIALQEDNTEWSGLLLGREGNVNFPLAPIGSRSPEREFEPFYKPLKNTQLHLSWYKMPSGKYEVTVYVS